MTSRIHHLVERQAESRPGGAAAIDPLGGVDYTGYAGAIRDTARLLTEAGTGPGDRVLIVAENGLAAAAAIFAASRLDAVAVPVNARMTAAELARIRDHAAPRVLLYTTGVSSAAQAHAEAAGATRHDLGFGLLALSPGPAGPPDPVEAGAAQTAVMLYTTGTTGAPKGVMLSHGNLVFAGRASCDLRGMTASDRVYGALPLTHVFGLASMLMASATCGACVELVPRFSPERLLEALRQGVTVLPAVPQMHALLMKHTAETGIDRLQGAALRYVSSGAAPLDPAWKRKAEAFYGLALQNGYGMTESTAGISGTRNPIGTADVSVGPALPGIEIAIDAPGPDGVGEILTRGPHVMKGYYNAPEATRAVLSAEGWLGTGDLGRIDGDGNLHIVGRSKELIIRSGFNVYPPEVEAALNDHPAVVQAAVIGRSRDGNEDVLAFVETRAPGATSADDLRAFVADRLSSYKRPSHILIVDTLPAAATGKILKHRLLEVFADRLAALTEE